MNEEFEVYDIRDLDEPERLVRTDVHRPGAIEPADYVFVAFEYLGPEAFEPAAAYRQIIREHMQATGGTYSRHAHRGNCHICGAHCIYTALFYHAKTNSYIRTGLECAEKLECGGIESFRAACREALGNRAGKRKAEALLDREGLSAAWAIYAIAPEGQERRQEVTIRDIVSKLVQYGKLTASQFGYLKTLVQQVAHRAETDALRAAESASAEPLPITEDRVTVVGEIVSVCVPKRYQGGPTRILVKAEPGWKVWGSRPAAFRHNAHGDRVQFDATIVPSKDDPKFGFFKRPTKCVILSTHADS